VRDALTSVIVLGHSSTVSLPEASYSSVLRCRRDVSGNVRDIHQQDGRLNQHSLELTASAHGPMQSGAVVCHGARDRVYEGSLAAFVASNELTHSVHPGRLAWVADASQRDQVVMQCGAAVPVSRLRRAAPAARDETGMAFG
jgi:hypothetical protein